MPYPYTIFEITIRTMQERFLLRPSKPLNILVLGVIGRALDKYPKVRIYLFKVMSNHIHIILSAPDVETLSAFMNHINSNIAREACRMHGWKDKFWSRRYKALPVLDRKSQIKCARYVISHGCKEGLVSSPTEWPGVGCERSLLFGEKLEGIWYDRSAFYQAEKRGKNVRLEDFAISYEVPLTPLPFLENKSEDEMQDFYRGMVKEIEDETKAKSALEGREPLGIEAVLSRNPHSRPQSPKRQPAPWCHASNIRRRQRYIRAYKAFVAAYHRAVDRLKRGERDVRFPDNCFLPPLAHCGMMAEDTAPG